LAFSRRSIYGTTVGYDSRNRESCDLQDFNSMDWPSTSSRNSLPRNNHLLHEELRKAERRRFSRIRSDRMARFRWQHHFANGQRGARVFAYCDRDIEENFSSPVHLSQFPARQIHFLCLRSPRSRPRVLSVRFPMSSHNELAQVSIKPQEDARLRALEGQIRGDGGSTGRVCEKLARDR